MSARDFDCEQVEDALNSLHLSFWSGDREDALAPFRFFRCPSRSAYAEGRVCRNLRPLSLRIDPSDLAVCRDSLYNAGAAR